MHDRTAPIPRKPLSMVTMSGSEKLRSMEKCFARGSIRTYTVSMLVVALVLAAPATVCTDLESGTLVGRVVIMPASCKGGKKPACDALRKQLFECFRADDITTGE